MTQWGFIPEELTRHEQGGFEYRLMGNYIPNGSGGYEVLVTEIQIMDETAGWKPVEEALEWH